MRDYQERRKLRSFFASRFVLIVLFILALGAGVVSLQALARSWEAKDERIEADVRLQNLVKKRDEAKEELEDLDTSYGVEREARGKLNLRKPGEEIVILKEEVREAEDPSVSASPWVRFKRMFTNQ